MSEAHQQAQHDTARFAFGTAPFGTDEPRTGGAHSMPTAEFSPAGLLAADRPDEPGEPDPALRRPRSRRSAKQARQAAQAKRAGIPAMSRRNLLLSGAAAVAAASGTGKLLISGTGKTAPSALAKAAATADGNQGLSTITQPLSSSSKTTATTKKKPGFALSKKLDPHLLLSRTTYGRTAAMEHDLHRMGATAWLNHQLSPAGVKDPGGAAVAKLYPRLNWSALAARKNLKDGDWGLMQDTVSAHLGRAIFSSRQLNEVMVDFWANHLNITCPSGDVWDNRHRYQIDVIRKYALGSFASMLLASAVHPSMLVYLNGAESTGQFPNENYAREVLELHTVGVDSGYTERDIQKAALLLTGWTMQNGVAKYNPAGHYVGRIKAFGFSTANASAVNGRTGQRAYLQFLAHHPKTAQHIATKLAQRFVSDSPPKSLVVKLAAAYKKHNTAIVPVLQALFSSPEFAASTGEKVRRPMEVVVASARVIGVRLGSNAKGLGDLANTLNDMGHVPLGWAMPNGYADVAASWQSPASALAQFNQSTTMVHGWWPTTLVLPGPQKILAKPPTTRNAVISAVAVQTLGRKPTARETSAAHTLLNGTKLPSSFGAGSYEQQETVALATTLFLSSPAHLTR